MDRPVIDLSEDSKATAPFRRWARVAGIGLLIWVALALGLKAIGGGGVWGAAAFVLFLYATLMLYLSDVPNGNLAALRGMIVGGVGVALWAGWYCARTTEEFSPFLGVVGAVAGGLAGALFGAIAGVFLGWVKRSVGAAFTRAGAPAPKPAADVSDRWTDGV